MGLQIGEALETFRESGAEDELRSKLSDAYGPEFEDVFSNAGPEDLERVASKATRGIHTATPVFDGASCSLPLVELHIPRFSALFDESG